MRGGVRSPPITVPKVPISPAFFPALSKMYFIMWVVVVFPFVPVTPIVTSFFAGWPKNAAERRASALLDDSVLSTATSGGMASPISRSTTMAQAPRSTASEM